MLCNSCDCIFINGVKCHEHGCPDSWKDYKKECKWCGQEFKPDARDQNFCSDECAEAYYN